ncbi:MAG: endoglucanase [Candidatus Omnitrophica bacterium]|nr:endoglucanase [Candidatus Omnitrophota bacterium]
MKKILKPSLVVLTLFLIILGNIFCYIWQNTQDLIQDVPSQEILHQTWQAYKQTFIRDGRVLRPKNDDTVSEGQAYAMLRAIVMDDQETFNELYRFTEEHLSRRQNFSDHLLAWQWKNGTVYDWMPATDADVDYALSLILAHRKWKPHNESKLEAYDIKASQILKDILQFETKVIDGRRYLLPWIVKDFADGIVQNLSYYSPAHFRLFYEYSDNHAWMELVETSYQVLNSALSRFDGNEGKGLLPDWCLINSAGEFVHYSDKSSNFGWDAIRIPFRIAADEHYFKSKEAQEILVKMHRFFNDEYQKKQKIFIAYNYQGRVVNRQENALFYAGYYLIFKDREPDIAIKLLLRTRRFLNKQWLYHNTFEYFINSLAWIPEYL